MNFQELLMLARIAEKHDATFAAELLKLLAEDAD